MTTEQALLLSRDTLTQAWRNGNWKELVGFFHPAIVFLTPAASPLCVGPEACLTSYQEFSTYEYQQAMNREQGTEVLAWIRHKERWLVIWRMVLSSPEASQS